MFTVKEILNIKDYKELVGQKVYYVKESYGIHTVESYDETTGLYKLNLDGQRFYSTPNKLIKVK